MATVNSVKTTDSSFQENAGEMVSKSLDDIVKKKLKGSAGKKTVLPVLQHVDQLPQREFREASLSQQGGALAEIRAKQAHDQVLSRILHLQEKADNNLKSNDIAVMETQKKKTTTGPLHARIMINPEQKIPPQSVTDRSEAMKIANGKSLNPSPVYLASSLKRDEPGAKKAEAAENRVMPETRDGKGHPSQVNLASSSKTDESVAKKTEAAENRVMPETRDGKGHPERENLLHQLSGNTSAQSQRVNDPVQEKVLKQMNVAKDVASWGNLIETSRVADNPSGVNEGSGNSKLTYTFSNWGEGHKVNVQINSNQGIPLVLHPSDTLVHQRLSDQSGQHHVQPEWVFDDEHEQSQRAHKQPQPDEEQA